MILCDTNILIEVYRGNLKIVDKLTHIGQINMAVSDVTCAELFFGARNKKELQAIRKDINGLTVLSIDSSISSIAVNLVEKYSISHKLALPDALIAATAIKYNVELYTLNIKDFKFIDGLKLIN